MVLEATEDFQIEWQDEARANATWIFEPMHFPSPLTPLSADVVTGLAPVALGCEAVVVHGYVFFGDRPEPPPPPEVIERGPRAVWEEDYVPRIRSLCERMRQTDYDALSLEELAGELNSLVPRMGEAFRLSMLVTGFFDPTLYLLMFCNEALGEDAIDDVSVLIQAAGNEVAGSGLELTRLADIARSMPEVARCLQERRFDEIEAAPGGDRFMAELSEFLAEYGWRGETWGELSIPTWAEAPAKALAILARYVADPERTAASAIERAQAQHREAVESVEKRLTAEQTQEFRRLLEAARDHVPVSESRAHWQLTLMGSLRVPVLAMGRKLAEAGVIDEPDDIFYLTLAEARGEGIGALTTAVRERKERMERQATLQPPPFLGPAPDLSGLPPEYALAFTYFFGYAPPEVTGNVIKGQAASRGVVRARARVLRDPGEADRLQPGEVMVCETTTQPWTPLFAIAGAVVTDTGGVLSHSAICAREYAIPCVVATQVATRVIPDGAVVTVDGGAGTVTLEG